MNKFMKKLAFAGFAVLAAAGVAHAAGPSVNSACMLIGEMQGVFKILRTLAFVGAAFVIAAWAWGFIKAGDVKMDDLKDKGVGLLVGFTLLFSIGMVLQFLGPITGCANLVSGW